MKLNYEEEKNKALKNLDKEKHLVLATSQNNHVTTRSISHIVMNDKIYFQTDKNFIKVKQIRDNKKVALCSNNINIEGEATICMHPYENSEFIDKFKIKQPSAYEQYSNLEDEIIIEISPTFLTIWEYIDKEPLRIYIDFNKKIVTYEYYKPAERK